MFAGFGGDYDFNQATIEGFGTLTTNQRKPFFDRFGWSQNFRYYGSDASNNYHGLQLKADKRFSRGYSLLAHYTWSRSFNYTNTYYNIDQDLAYGPNDNHREHVFGLHSVWELPVGKDRRYLGDANGVVDAILGGWQVNNVFTWQSGLPFTPSYRDCNADRDTGWCRPDLVGEWKPENQSAEAWFVTTPLAPTGASRPSRSTGRRSDRGDARSAARSEPSGATGCSGRRSHSGISRSSRTSPSPKGSGRSSVPRRSTSSTT